MTKEEIIDMARQSAFTRHREYEKCLVCNPYSLYHFAKLVTEKEREECAKLCDESEYPDGIDLAYLIRARGQE